jgi:hypothetical protein
LDGWDLEGVLSGEPVWLPEGMRPVASTLAALRSAPVPAELAGEAAARAMFRQLMNGGAGQAPQLAEPVDSRTVSSAPASLTVPFPASSSARARSGRRHAHRRPPRRGRLRPAMLIGAAGVAAAIIAGGVALAGGFSGGGQPGLHGRNAAATGAAPSTSHSALGGVEGSGTKTATASPTPSHSGGQQSSSGSAGNSGPSELCRQYLDFIAHQESSSDWAAESSGIRQLTTLAGSKWQVTSYCLRLQPWSDQSGYDSGGLGTLPYSQYSADGAQGQGNGGGQQSGDNGNGGGNGGGSDHGNAGNGGGNGNGNGNGKGSGNGHGANGSGAGNQNKQ